MGLMSWILGGGAKQAAAAVGQVAGVFKPNAEASEARGHAYDGAALGQYAAEFAHPRRGWFEHPGHLPHRGSGLFRTAAQNP